MDTGARVTSKGQVTIPKSVREALDLHAGDELLFRVERSRAVVAKTPDFLQLAGTVAIPAGKRGTAWDEVLHQTRAARAGRTR
jgi:antitoxin PrlF